MWSLESQLLCYHFLEFSYTSFPSVKIFLHLNKHSENSITFFYKMEFLTLLKFQSYYYVAYKVVMFGETNFPGKMGKLNTYLG